MTNFRKVDWHLVRFAQYDPKSGLTLLWYGNSYIHAVTGDGVTKSAWAIETPCNPPMLLDVMDSITRAIDKQYFPE